MPRSADTRRDLIVLQLTGHLFFLFLFLLSLVYWKERQAFDAGHYLVELINRQFFFVAHGRPIGVVSQWLPLLAVWLHLPLKAVALLYSIGDILWYYLVFLLLAHGLQTRRGIITLLLMLSLTVCYSFFCPVTELLQALVLIPVWQCLLERSFRLRLPLLILLTALILFSHPLLFFPLSFAFVWHLLHREKAGALFRADQHRVEGVTAGAILVFTALKFALLDEYDHGKTFYPVVYQDYGYLKSLGPSVFFHHVAVVMKAWPLMTIIFGASLLVYLSKRQWRKGLFLFSAVALYLLIVSASHRFDQTSNYFERILLPLPAIVAIGAAGIIGISRVFVPKLLAFTGLVLVLLLHFDLLRITAQPYTLRVIQLRDLCQQASLLHQSKAILKEEQLEQFPFAMCGWSTTLESLLLSALDGPQQTVTIALQRDHILRHKSYGKPLPDTCWVAWAENVQPLSTLNPAYFHLPAQPYRSLLSEATASSAVRVHLNDQWALREGGQVLRLAVEGDKNGRTGLADSTAMIRFSQPGKEEIKLQPLSDISGGAYFMVYLPSKDAAEGLLTLSLGGSDICRLPLFRKDGRWQEEKK
jgi:hypothetical protein